MKALEIAADEFDMYIKEAGDKLRNHEFKDAYFYIMNAISANPNAPEPHNLLGLWYELKGNNELARKHYRVAYVLNPVYKPASENLERVSTLFLRKEIPLNYGEPKLEDAEEANKVNKDGKES